MTPMKPLVALLFAAALTVPAARAQDASSAGFDAAAAWREFLARKDALGAFDAYDVLDKIGYDLHAVDAAGCGEQRKALAGAVAAAPVSIAMRHAALLCAQATGDAAAAAREGGAFEALSRLSLSQASDLNSDPPIRVLATLDAYALIAGMGLDTTYSYYLQVNPARYMPFVLVAWDEEAGSERHLRFDTVDTMNALIHTDPYSGYPFQRYQIADALLERQAADDVLMAQDLAAVRAAAVAATPADKVAKLRDAAAAGGVQAAANWMTVCQTSPYSGCTDGLIDALLPAAEERRVVSMTMLAYAYAQGLGIAADQAAATDLLDAADRRWPHGGASAYYAISWALRHSGALPAAVQARIDIARRAGNPVVDDFMLLRQVNAGDQPLDAAAIGRLSRPELNARGAGYSLLASYYQQQRDDANALVWQRRAAEAGDADGMAAYGARLHAGEGVAQDREAARAMLENAAHGGSALAARMLAYQAGEQGDWKQAMSWLLAPVTSGDLGAILDTARIYEYERPGFTGQQAHAVEIYTSIAADPSGAEARRRLAYMALQGRGMAKSVDKARQWLLQDAEKGDTESQAALGSTFLEEEYGQVDEAQGRQWLEKAMQAGDADAYSGFGLWLINEKDTPESRREGLQVLQAGVDKFGDQGGLNNLAWALCTGRRDDVRDPARGLTVAKRLGDPERLAAGVLDTLAACVAASGDYARGAQLQADAVQQFQAFADAGGARADGDGRNPETRPHPACVVPGRQALY